MNGPALIDESKFSVIELTGFIHVHLPGKPDTPLRAALKRGGFKWDAATMTWRGRVGDRTRSAAQNISAGMRSCELTEPGGYLLQGVRVVDYAAIERTRLYFPLRPGDAARRTIKDCGFKWDRFRGCWSRPWSDDSGVSAVQLLARLAEAGGGVIQYAKTSSEGVPDAPAGRDLHGVRLVELPGSDRIQLYFGGRLLDDDRKFVKRHGFRWAANSGAWQAPLQPNGREVAERVVNGLTFKGTEAITYAEEPRDPVDPMSLF